MPFEIWDRVTGRIVAERETLEEAEAVVEGPYRKDFIIIDQDEE